MTSFFWVSYAHTTIYRVADYRANQQISLHASLLSLSLSLSPLRSLCFPLASLLGATLCSASYAIPKSTQILKWSLLIWVFSISCSDHRFGHLKSSFFLSFMIQISWLRKIPYGYWSFLSFLWVLSQIQSNGFHGEDAYRLYYISGEYHFSLSFFIKKKLWLEHVFLSAPWVASWFWYGGLEVEGHLKDFCGQFEFYLVLTLLSSAVYAL